MTPNRCTRAVVGAAYWLLAALTGCDFPGRPDPAERPVAADEVVDFDVLFQTHCAGCHGKDGTLGPAPPLADALFVSLISERDLHETIAGGRSGTPMPAFLRSQGGTLLPRQVEVLTAGIKERWNAKRPVHPNAPPYQLARQRQRPGDRKLGEEVFARACAECHGSRGEGGDMAGAINDPNMLALLSDQALRRLAITGRQDLGMPDFAGTDGRDENFRPLSSDEIDALVALVASWRHQGAGNP